MERTYTGCSVRMEMDAEGNHRIVAWDRKGDWAHYSDVSVLVGSHGVYIAVTEYYTGVLPTERVLYATEVFDGDAGLKLVDGVRPE